MINNNNNSQHPAMQNDGVDPIGYNPQVMREYLQYEQSGTKRGIDDGRPSLNPQEYAPGTILSDTYFNSSSDGIHEISSYSVNTVEQDEVRLREVEKQRRRGYSTYNSPPLNSGAPFLSEEVKPTQQQLETQVKQSQIDCLTNKIQQLQNEKTVLESKLINVERAIHNSKLELEGLEK